ncbi:MAG TPA: DUF1801 domain-containing protein [Candidatus Methylomirabilis sp.]|nr:DUF1801 domain-containing protein [Candidatus Methylomirabilis sp.]
MNPKVDLFLRKAKKWREESEKLRMILLDFPLTEELKWGEPCYTLQGKNVVLIGGFKEYVTLLFFQGALLKDTHRILVAPGNTQAKRQIRFTSLQQILAMEAVLKAYIREAIEVEEAGLKVKLRKHSDYVIPQELQKRLDEIPALKAAFEALTPGRQRAYMFHISKPKQSKTRESTVEKCIPQILAGKGLND